MLSIQRALPVGCAAAVLVLISGCSGGGTTSAAVQPVLPSISGATKGPAVATSSPTPAATTSASASSAPTSSTVGCTNATVTDAVRSALVVADGRPAAIEQPGKTYYGSCGSDSFAVASFEPASTATAQQSVAFQDHGAYPEFFTKNDAASWILVGSAAGPPGPTNCADFSKAPSALRELWQNCAATASPTATSSNTSASAVDQACATFAAQTFAQLVSASVSSDGSAVATAHPVTVHCGGPDDHQFIPGPQSETIDIPATAHIAVLKGANDATTPATAKQLAASLTEATTPHIFLISGSIQSANGVTEEFVP